MNEGSQYTILGLSQLVFKAVNMLMAKKTGRVFLILLRKFCLGEICFSILSI